MTCSCLDDGKMKMTRTCLGGAGLEKILCRHEFGIRKLFLDFRMNKHFTQPALWNMVM